MIQKICILALYFAPNRQVRLSYLEKIIPKDIELFLFTKHSEVSKFKLNRFKIIGCKSNLSSFIELRKFCIKNSIDFVLNLGQVPQEGFVILFSTLFTKTSFYMYEVGNPYNSYKSYKSMLKLKAFIEVMMFFPLIYFSAKTFFASSDILKRTKKYIFLPKNKMHYLPGTINTELFMPKNKEQTRKKLNLIDKKIVVFVGRIEKGKGSDILLELARRNNDILFLLIGKLDDKNIEKAMLKNIKILPPKDSEELVDYYNSADLFVFPSKTEGFGFVPREAMSCGIPTIVSDIAALNSIQKAIKVPINILMFDNALKNFFSLSKTRIAKLSRESRENIIKEYSDENCKNLYLNELLN